MYVCKECDGVNLKMCDLVKAITVAYKQAKDYTQRKGVLNS